MRWAHVGSLAAETRMCGQFYDRLAFGDTGPGSQMVREDIRIDRKRYMIMKMVQESGGSLSLSRVRSDSGPSGLKRGCETKIVTIKY